MAARMVTIITAILTTITIIILTGINHILRHQKEAEPNVEPEANTGESLLRDTGDIASISAP
jgi:hypothetical protein